MKMLNKIPTLIQQRGLTPTELHRLTKSLSWPTVQELASQNKAKRELPGRTTLKTMVEISQALGCKVDELFEVIA